MRTPFASTAVLALGLGCLTAGPAAGKPAAEELPAAPTLSGFSVLPAGYGCPAPDRVLTGWDFDLGSMQGAEADLKRIYLVDLRDGDQDGYVDKRELVDPMEVADPQGLGSEDGTDRMPYVTIDLPQNLRVDHRLLPGPAHDHGRIGRVAPSS